MCPYKYILCIYPDPVIREQVYKNLTERFNYDIVCVGSLEEAKPYIGKVRVVISHLIYDEPVYLPLQVHHWIPHIFILTFEKREHLVPSRIGETTTWIDDSITLPFDQQELYMRVSNLLARTFRDDQAHFGDCRDDAYRGKVQR